MGEERVVQHVWGEDKYIQCFGAGKVKERA